MLRGKFWLPLTALICISPLAQAVEKPWEFNVSAGTNGLGLELSTRFSDQLRLRGGYHFYDLSIDTDAENNNGTSGDELKYSSDLELSNFGAILDWYPWGGVFRVSAGAVYNDNNFKVEASCENPSGCEVGSSQFSRTEIGTITTRIDVQEFGPYLGIGWDKGIESTGRWIISFDIGAYYQGSPDVEMTSNGSCVNSALIGAACRAALEEEENEIEDEIEDYVFYPVVTLGIGYRF